MKRTTFVGLVAASVLGSVAAQAQSLNAAGASFPAAIYQKWFEEFKEAKINYQSVGSGAGIQQLTMGTVDFGASDMPMTDEQKSKLKVPAVHIPTVVGGVVPAYNVPGVSGDIKFTGETLAGIYLGDIKKWNDPKIMADNKGMALPANDIVVVHRSDGSGTTFVWTNYLGKVSPTWKTKVGESTSVAWPVSGLAGKGNDGVAGIVKQTPNSIGYVELVYAAKNGMSFGPVKNSAGKFVKASVKSVTDAAAAATEIPTNITNAPGAGSYPIASFTYLLVPTKIADAGKKKVIVDFLNWAITTGQKDAPGLDYSPLPGAVVKKAKTLIATIQ